MRTIIAVLIAISMATAGCTSDTSDDAAGTADKSETSTGSSSSQYDEAGEGSASIYVQDAPTDEFKEIHVVFTKVTIHAAGTDGDDEDDVEEEHESDNETDDDTQGDGNSTDDNGTADDDDVLEGNETGDSDDDEGKSSSWITLFENANGTDIDLLAASGDASAFLGEAKLSAGKYTQIRIDVANAYGINHDNETENITVASGTLKIVKSFEVETDEESQIIVDFDLDKSLKQTGKGWKMTPVIGKTVVNQVDDESSGADVDEEGKIYSGKKPAPKDKQDKSDDDSDEEPHESEDNSTEDAESTESDNATA